MPAVSVSAVLSVAVVLLVFTTEAVQAHNTLNPSRRSLVKASEAKAQDSVSVRHTPGCSIACLDRLRDPCAIDSDEYEEQKLACGEAAGGLVHVGTRAVQSRSSSDPLRRWSDPDSGTPVDEVVCGGGPVVTDTDDGTFDVTLHPSWNLNVFGASVTSVRVNANGLVAFGPGSIDLFPSSSTAEDLTNNQAPVIAASWDDNRIYPGGLCGALRYCEVLKSTDSAHEVWAKADLYAQELKSVSPGALGAGAFEATHAFVATWDGVCRFGDQAATDGTNSYQTVVACDVGAGTCLTAFNYGKMSWARTPTPQSGFYDFVNRPNAPVTFATTQQEKLSLPSYSNVGVAGRFVFDLGVRSSRGPGLRSQTLSSLLNSVSSFPSHAVVVFLPATILQTGFEGTFFQFKCYLDKMLTRMPCSHNFFRRYRRPRLPPAAHAFTDRDLAPESVCGLQDCAGLPAQRDPV
mmetsp:Transcript_67151/g.165712  ORF Transcript_67151/g.165712 Transcript_67151/m.165712 type:complete len:461 (-) Transcript_67151:206-1588(-)